MEETITVAIFVAVFVSLAWVQCIISLVHRKDMHAIEEYDRGWHKGFDDATYIYCPPGSGYTAPSQSARARDLS